MNGVQLIRAERSRQQRKLGWSKRHDAELHRAGELAEMGAYLASPTIPTASFVNRRMKIVTHLGWSITPHDRINELVKAGALIAAEIDRLLAAAEPKREKNQ